MLINNCMWLAFWMFYFERFPVARGWTRQDMICLWAIVSTGYGVAAVLFGNFTNLSGLIFRGELDVYMTQPKNVLLHMLSSKTTVSAVGDVLFGLSVFGPLGEPSAFRWVLFLFSALLVAVYMTAFGVLAHSLAFFFGNAEALAMQLHSSILHFSTYPTAIFEGRIRVVLFTLIPAGFISHLPVGVVREVNPVHIACAVLGAVVFGAISVWVFDRGLRRYESGNLMTTRV